MISFRNVDKVYPNGVQGLKNVSLDIVYQDLEEKMKQKLNTKVAISGKGDGSGKIEIEFYSHDDLDRILDMIK